ITGRQAGLPAQSGSAQSMSPSESSSTPLLQISTPGLMQARSPKQPGSWQSTRLLQLSSLPLLQISGLAGQGGGPSGPPSRAPVPRSGLVPSLPPRPPAPWPRAEKRSDRPQPLENPSNNTVRAAANRIFSQCTTGGIPVHRKTPQRATPH